MTLQNKKLIYFLLFAFVLVMGLLWFSHSFTIAHASTNVDSFEKSDILDDLMSATIDGKKFSLEDFKPNANGEPSILFFAEYGYSTKSDRDYGLYVFVYNPARIAFSMSTSQDKIQMAVKFDESGNAIQYEKFNLTFLSRTTDAGIENLFYKFKISDRPLSDGTTFYDRVDVKSRKYVVSGIELVTGGKQNATEYGVATEYEFTGFAEGYGDKDDPSLQCKSTKFETIELDVHHTTYRTNQSSLGKGHYNSIHTAYFAVPEYYFENYGYLEKIRAEWWEYKTKMALITSDLDCYNEAMKYIKSDASKTSVPFTVSSLSHSIANSFVDTFGSVHGSMDYYYDFGYNTKVIRGNIASDRYFFDYSQNILPFVFYSENDNDVQSVFDFLYSKSSVGTVDSTIVKDWIYSYSNDLGNGYIDCNGRKISKDLFFDCVDSGRTIGHNDKTISFDETFELNSYDSNHSWWDKLLDFGFSWPETDGDYVIDPIVTFDYDDLISTNIAEKYFINSNDVASFVKFATQSKQDNKRVILFRFANTDYFSSDANCSIYKINEKDFWVSWQNSWNDCSYVASQTVFLDFDIIELTFNKNGVQTVIPVVASPSDVVADFIPPAESFDWWKVVLAVILLVLILALVLYILWPVLPYIFKGIVWLFNAPRKALIKHNKKMAQKCKTQRKIKRQATHSEKQQQKKLKKELKKKYGKKKKEKASG